MAYMKLEYEVLDGSIHTVLIVNRKNRKSKEKVNVFNRKYLLRIREEPEITLRTLLYEYIGEKSFKNTGKDNSITILKHSLEDKEKGLIYHLYEGKLDKEKFDEILGMCEKNRDEIKLQEGIDSVVKRYFNRE